MSIINNVLKDLESRPSRFKPIEIAVNDSGPTEPRVAKVSLLVLLPVLVVLGVGLFYYQTIYQSDRNRVAAAVTVTPDKSVSSSVERTPVVEAVQNHISGLQIQESSSEVSLEFSLQQKAVLYLKERSDDLFIFHLKDVRSEIEAPTINNNRWIEDLQILPGQQGIDVVLKTAPGVLVNTAQENNQGESIWTISLEKLPDLPNLAELETDVKEPVIKPEVVAAKEPEPTASKEEKIETPAVKVEIKTVDQSQVATVKLNRATELVRAGQWQQAEPLLLSLIGGPLDFAARRQLMVLYSRSGKDDSYLQFAKQTQLRYPQESIFRTELARAFFQHQQYLQTIDLLRNAGDLDAAQHALLAASYQRTDRHQQAVEHYHHALKLDQGQARNWIGLGISLEHEAKLEKALQSYKTALRLGNLSERLTAFVEQRSRAITKVIN